MAEFPPLTAEHLAEIKRLHLAGIQPSGIAERIFWRRDDHITARRVRIALLGMRFYVSEPNSDRAHEPPWPKRDAPPWPVLPALCKDRPGFFEDRDGVGTGRAGA